MIQVKKLWKTLGTVAFWLSWPLLWLYLRRSRRTRVLVVCGKEIILIHGWLGSGEWSLPGGGLHRKESITEGVVRELREETGVNIQHTQLTELFEGTYRAHGLKFPYTCFVLELSEKKDVRPQRFEIIDALWVGVKDIKTMPTGPDVRAAVQTWFKGGNTVK